MELSIRLNLSTFVIAIVKLTTAIRVSIAINARNTGIGTRLANRVMHGRELSITIILVTLKTIVFKRYICFRIPKWKPEQLY